MKTRYSLAALGCLLPLVSASYASTGSPFYGDPPDDTHPWAVHDWNRPQPPRVEPRPYDAAKAQAPADAVVLFDGTAESLNRKWEADKSGHEATKWVVSDGAMECTPGSGYIRTKEAFGDCQLHVEWAAPVHVKGDSQGRGNSGVFLMGMVEIQVLDNYNNPTYADGFACAVYGVHPPLANALRPPGEFQSEDITFHRPVYQDGKCIQPGWVTVYCNGVLVQDRTQLEGGTGHMARSKPGPLPETGPLKLQDHGNPVRFRNIWYRPLPSQAPAGGYNGPMTPAAAAAKRQEIAATIRSDAARLANPAAPMAGFYRLAESLYYDKDKATLAQVEQTASQYITSLKALAGEQLLAKKEEARHLRDVLKYLVRAQVIDGTFTPKADLDQLIKEQNWDKKK
ncbi:MAG: family 16 glycoside hydrolase [Verrucomicrobiota bacterium]